VRYLIKLNLGGPLTDDCLHSKFVERAHAAAKYPALYRLK